MMKGNGMGARRFVMRGLMGGALRLHNIFGKSKRVVFWKSRGSKIFLLANSV
ncbi:MAG: hypothetical protein NTV68_00355 [Methanomicrobiales archaeon]|nr:hypothetical protein [Methanomicrobiales archaeon]